MLCGWHRTWFINDVPTHISPEISTYANSKTGLTPLYLSDHILFSRVPHFIWSPWVPVAWTAASVASRLLLIRAPKSLPSSQSSSASSVLFLGKDHMRFSKIQKNNTDWFKTGTADNIIICHCRIVDQYWGSMIAGLLSVAAGGFLFYGA